MILNSVSFIKVYKVVLGVRLLLFCLKGAALFSCGILCPLQATPVWIACFMFLQGYHMID